MRDVLGVIFSRDRAMQLDAVLRSLFLHCRDVDKVDIWILYTTTNERHAKQYHELSEEYSGRVSFMPQKNFRQDMLTLLNLFEKMKFWGLVYRLLSAFGKIGPPFGSQFDRIWRRTVNPILINLSTLLVSTFSKEYFVLFLVDDNLFVQDFYLKNAIDILKQKEKLLGFSLRLGENTTYFYSRGRKQFPPSFESLGNNVAHFDWTTSDGDFGYPLEISSSIYRFRDVLPLLMGFSFENPNILEDRMAFNARYFRSRRPLLACYNRSVTFCNPINMVQSVITNRVGESIRYSADELLSRFEQGERIRIEAFNGFIPESCHQEVELVFGKTGD
jgi:hypothetical protein